MIVDCHTHNPLAEPPAVISVEPGATLDPHRLYSVGIHPWHTLEADDTTVKALEQMALQPNVVAIGETGLDSLRGAPLDVQEQMLRRHVALSEKLHKPLILHVVRCYPQIINLRRELRPTQPWIIHGFRGGPELAKELLRHGFHLSIGEHFNRATQGIIPPDRLHFETDDSPLPIDQIAAEYLSQLKIKD